MLPDDMSKDNSHFPPLQLGSSAAAATAATTDGSDSAVPPSPHLRLRSLSDGGARTPVRGRLSSSTRLSGPYHHSIRDNISIASSHSSAAPMTPQRPPPSASAHGYPPQQMTGAPQQQEQRPVHDQKDQPPTTPVSSTHLHRHLQQQQQQQHIYLDQPIYMSNSIPLSPKLDSSQIYASHSNILPRRSRGLDFSRAATSLHHSTLAEQPSPDSSPSNSCAVGNHGAMAIPGRRGVGDYAGAPETSTSLWSVMGRGARDSRAAYPSSSLGSISNAIADSSTSSDDNDSMDEDTEEPFVTTPQVGKTNMPNTPDRLRTSMPWLPSSPATGSLLSFQHRQRPRKQSKRKIRGPLGLGFSSVLASPASLMTAAGSSSGGSGSGSGSCSGSGIANLFSRSPPGNTVQDLAQYRRESISWAANQLHISGSESDDNLKASTDGDGATTATGRDGQRNVIRRAVTRRGNLLPKTKGFARIRAALAEESAPAEAEFRREAEVVRQVLDKDVEQSSLPPPPPLRSTPTTASSSPRLFDNLEDAVDDFMTMDASSLSTGLGLSTTNVRQQVNRSTGGSRPFWERPERSVTGGITGVSGSLRVTTPPPSRSRGPASSLGMADDVTMYSPVGSGVGPFLELKTRQGNINTGYFVYPHGAMFPMTAASSPGNSTPQATGPVCPSSSSGQQRRQEQPQHQHQQPVLPSAAELTRRINSKRRRDDDLDPVSFKRRAVSPGMSVHSSPVMQSPLQRDVPPWVGLTTAALTSRPGSGGGGSNGNSSMGLDGSGSGGSGSGSRGNKGRVGYQAMAEANDSITRLSIE